MRGIDTFAKEYNKVVQDTREFYVLELTCSDQCTMRCTYCFEKSCGFTKTETLNESLPVLFDKIDHLLSSEVFEATFRGIQLDFWGGEPTINMDMLRSIIEKYKNEPKIYFHIYSNGYKIAAFTNLLEENKDNMNFKNRFNIQISYDGTPVHDKNRLNITGEPTSKEVLENADTLINMGYKVSFKATIIPEDFKYFPTIWEDFRTLYYKYKGKINVNYAPTVDYSNTHKNSFSADFEEGVVQIAKKEIDFFKAEKRHLFSWFTGDRGKFHCSAGRNIVSIDTEGSGYFCHGCLYLGEDDKKQFKVFSIYDEKDIFLNKIINQYYYMVENSPEKYAPKECETCEATMCLRCNSFKFVESEKESFFEKWYDYSGQKVLCSYFKFFGKIDRTVKRILEE